MLVFWKEYLSSDTLTGPLQYGSWILMSQFIQLSRNLPGCASLMPSTCMEWNQPWKAVKPTFLQKYELTNHVCFSLPNTEIKLGKTVDLGTFQKQLHNNSSSHVAFLQRLNTYLHSNGKHYVCKICNIAI